MWFLLTWTGCPRGNPSCFAALNKSIWSWLSLFCGFLFVIASEVFLHVKPDNIYMPLLFCIFSPTHVSGNVAWHKYLLLNYTMWEYAVMITTVCVLWSFYSDFKWVIFRCFHGYCFLHFGCSWGALMVAMLVRKVLAVWFRFYSCVFPRRFPLWHLKISCAPMSSKHTAASLHPTLLSIPHRCFMMFLFHFFFGTEAFGIWSDMSHYIYMVLFCILNELKNFGMCNDDLLFPANSPFPRLIAICKNHCDSILRYYDPCSFFNCSDPCAFFNHSFLLCNLVRALCVVTNLILGFIADCNWILTTRDEYAVIFELWG